MPITYTFDLDHNLVTTTATGTITLEEYKSYLERRQADPGYDLRMRGIFDARAATLAFSETDMRDLAQFIKPHLPGPNTRRAIVVSNDRDYGLVRTFQALAEDARLSYEVFRDMDEALIWVTGHKTTVKHDVSREQRKAAG
jgi:hypothetical protein